MAVSTMTSTATSAISAPSLTLSTSPETETAHWQEVGYRCPRPGFFLGDDGSLASSSVLLDNTHSANKSSKTLCPAWDLGSLGALPLELLHQIIGELGNSDVRALVNLRNCNRATAAVVDSFRDFATVAAFPRALGALVHLAPARDTHTGAPSAAGPTMSGLAACLRTTACASCLRQHGNDSDVPYGDYIYLLAPERVCYACFRSKPEYLPVARFAGGTGSLPVQGPDGDGTELTTICVPPGRYGVLARLTQPVNLFDRRQVERREAAAVSSSSSSSSSFTDKRTTPSRPDPLRYAAVIPGPYWVAEGSAKAENGSLDRGYSCRACCQTDRKSAGHAGWADPLARYTLDGLRQHVADPRFGGRVIKRRDPRTGAELYEHDAPRRGHFPPPVEFGATADLARRYEAVVMVPDKSVAGTRL